MDLEILKIASDTKNHKDLDKCTHSSKFKNPLCGDYIEIGVIVKNNQILDNAYGVLGIELMAAAQALDFRTHKFGDGVKLAKSIIREHVEFLDIDRPLYEDHNTMKKLVKSCEIVDKIEAYLGNLYEE